MSRKIIIIGTLHAGITPNEELGEVLDDLKPDQLFVEIAAEDIDNNNLDSYPPEMVFAFGWAKDRGIAVNGFDSKINVFREGVVPGDNLAVIEKQKELIKNLSWKEFNKEENNKLLDVEDLDHLVDREKEKEREQEMLQNIQNQLIESGVVVVVTGTAHLKFFQENIEGAIFPFRGLDKS